MIDPGDTINNYFGKKKGMIINHIIHFIEGCLAFKYAIIIPFYIIYQLYDSIDFNNLKNYPKDNIILDISIFCVGYWCINLISTIQ